MRVFDEMPAKYIVREIDNHQPKYRILFYRDMPTSDVHYAWVVGGSLFSNNIRDGIERVDSNPQPLPQVIVEDGNYIIEISKHDAFEWHLERFKQLGEHFAFLEIAENKHHPLFYIPFDRIVLESSTENLSKNT